MRLVKIALAAMAVMSLVGCEIRMGEGRLYALCESTLKDRLRSPSTYQRIKIDRYVQAMDEAAWVAAQKESGDMLKIRKDQATRAVAAGKQLQEISLFIEYDAANAFGTPIRGLSKCSYLTADEDESDLASVIGEYQIRVDGFNKNEWLMEQLRQSR